LFLFTLHLTTSSCQPNYKHTHTHTHTHTQSDKHLLAFTPILVITVMPSWSLCNNLSHLEKDRKGWLEKWKRNGKRNTWKEADRSTAKHIV